MNPDYEPKNYVLLGKLLGDNKENYSFKNFENELKIMI